jgi:hypothetical protein
VPVLKYAGSNDVNFADFFPRSQAPPATDAAMPSGACEMVSTYTAANLPPEEAYQDEVALDAGELPPPVDEAHLPSGVQEDWLCCPITMVSLAG